MKKVGRPSKSREEIKATKVTIETEDGEVIKVSNVKILKIVPDSRGRIYTGSKNKHMLIELD